MNEYDPNWPEIPDHPYKILIDLKKQMHCLI